MKNITVVCLLEWRRPFSKECYMQSPELCRRFHCNAHVRAFVVVEINNAFYYLPGFLQVLRTFHLIEPFLLNDTVHSFGNGIFRRVPVLCHADGGTYFLETIHILVTTVL